MKKLVTLLLIITSINVMAQAPAWNWAINAQCSGSYEYGYGVKIGSTGDIFATGRFANTMTMGGVSPSPGSGTPIYVARLDSSGAVQWITNVYSSGSYDYTYAMTLDDQDNTYVGINSSSGSGCGVVKCNSAGMVDWTSIATGGSSSGDGIGIDTAGNVYLTGYFSGTLNFGGSNIITCTASTYDMFLAKYNNQGIVQWVVKAGGSGYDAGKGIAIDASGNIYVVGGYTGVPTFGSITPSAAGTYSSLFIAKYNPSGTVLSVATATNAGIADQAWWEENEITIDPCGNLYVTGHFQNTANFGGLTVTSSGGDDIFVAKYTASGIWEWVKSAGGTGNDQGLGIAIDNDLAVYITGYFQNTANFENNFVTATGNSELFVAKYTTNATNDCSSPCSYVNLQWVQQGSGATDNGGNQIAVDNNKRAYITGSFAGTALFGSASLTSSGTGDIFIARLDSIPNRTIVPVPDSAYCAGSSYTVPFFASGTYTSGNVFAIQLSDASGSFANAVNIGVLSTTASGTANITIPAGTPGGNSYRIRVTSSNPVFTGTDLCFDITVNEKPTITVNSPSVCPGLTVILTADGGTSYSWSAGATNIGTDSASVSPVSTTTYTVTGTLNGCSNTATATVTINPKPTADFSMTPNGCEILFTNLSSGAASYLWSFGDDDTSANPTPSHLYTTSQVQPVELITTNNLGCKDTISKLPELGGSTLFIPNAFTPDHNDKNEIFKVAGVALTNFEGLIFNRWGEQLYSWKDAESGWDGTYKGKPVDDGVYVYLIKASSLCGGNPYQYQGTVMVFK